MNPVPGAAPAGSGMVVPVHCPAADSTHTTIRRVSEPLTWAKYVPVMTQTPLVPQEISSDLGSALSAASAGTGALMDDQGRPDNRHSDACGSPELSSKLPTPAHLSCFQHATY